MDSIGSKARGGANGVVIGVFWCSLQTMASICAIVWSPLQLVHGGRQPSAELRSIIGQEGGRTSPQRDEAVHQNVCGDFGGEFGCGDGKHVRSTAKAIRGEGVLVSSSRHRQGPKVVNTDGDAKAGG